MTISQIHVLNSMPLIKYSFLKLILGFHATESGCKKVYIVFNKFVSYIRKDIGNHKNW